ncbi:MULTISPECIES: substrate-binding domain-containing protein [Caproicibacterium]|jgi:ribose transport system substrate-binding protein|uniref:Substrate-binding domain-containing protein n=1 Tax=Caproicibacterium lactatifermentans TaxID=2666138 RepID=A0A859DPM1_9FIRM|nr:substrate-binding domain-containing protein [Caproicibacterium lactatifermentans]ARP50620.1 D-ribose ABC transporter substrate-binding protein [Ruminococcaceae bacterium CPB6]MDD4807267.1 substrate-binding domain-containing protein [Oscillospiraceae bacterium]QKN23646.1 substrate-binding domain-containing protein [Caproicibacterium lactatifermentans]QKO29681.1 substrate-binding domain-containing protein [Caproicibacterium lactatifermentans]
MKLKKVMAVLLSSVMLLSAAACTTGAEQTSSGAAAGATGEQSTGKAIGLSVSTLNNPFFVTLSDGAKAEAKKLGVQVTVADAGNDTAKQTNDIEDLISKNIGVLIVNPVDSDAVSNAVKDAKSKGIKVISVDRVVNGVDVDCKIASDNVSGAKMATEYLMSKVGKNAKIAQLEGTTGASATIDRGKGFHQAADGKAQIVASQTAKFDRATALNVSENILQAHGDVQGIFAQNDEMALGAVEAVAAAKKNVVIVGFDATTDGQSAVKSGKMAATVQQKPDLMGATAIDNAQKLLKGEKVAANVPVSVTLITHKG